MENNIDYEMKITICPFCRKTTLVKVNTKNFDKWKKGEYIQDALSELSFSDREMLITGICPKCWDENIPSEDEEQEE